MVHRLRPVGGISPFTDVRLLTGRAVPSRRPQAGNDIRQVGSLEDARLVGVCTRRRIRLVIASDLSGSMGRFTRARDIALDRLIRWVPGNLRLDDEVALLVFGSYAIVHTEPTTIRSFREKLTSQRESRSLTSTGTVESGIADATSLSPLIDVVKGLASPRQRIALILLSDGLFGDFPDDHAAARSIFGNAGVGQLFLIRPSESGLEQGEVDPWISLCSSPPMIADGGDPDATALSFGHVLATITGQRLELRNPLVFSSLPA